MKLVIRQNSDEVASWTAQYIATRINNFLAETNKLFVLGLPTGSSPLATYSKLINLNKAGEVSFRRVLTFNMDEYVALPQSHPESYYSFMHNNFFNHIDIDKANTNLLNGNASNVEAECEAYEQKIAAAGGIELFMGGIGIDGHLAFNEPGSSLTGRTHRQKLTYDTLVANSRFFNNDIKQVPNEALTVGIGTVMSAREVLIIVTGHNKARALRHIVEGGVNQMWTASALQLHPNATLVCDETAISELKVATYRYYKEMY